MGLKFAAHQPISNLKTALGKGILPGVFLVASNVVTAYSFPDGAMYIHTSLLARLENEAESGGV
jgi:hypothetical protein